jgi:hypothetical protein
MAWRLTDWLKSEDKSVPGRRDDNDAAVICVLAMAFGLVMSAFAGAEFAAASPVAQMFEKPEAVDAIRGCGLCDAEGLIYDDPDGGPIRCHHDSDDDGAVR